MSNMENLNHWSDKGGGDGYFYKKYSYHSSSKQDNMLPSNNKNIEQLDTLLEDLKLERNRDALCSSTYRTLDHQQNLPNNTFIRSERIVETHAENGQNNKTFLPVHNLPNTTITRSERIMETHPETTENKTTFLSGYTNLKSTLPYNNRTNDDFRNTFESQNKLYGSKQYTETTEINKNTSSLKPFERDLEAIPLTDDILPIPGTKVTTTVRTYTYELPAELNNTKMSQNHIYGSSWSSQNDSIPHSIIYETENTTLKSNKEPIISNKMYEIQQIDRNVSDNNMNTYASRNDYKLNQKLIGYEVNSTERNEKMNYKPDQYKNPILPNTYTDGNTNRYYFKESINTVNTVLGPGNTTHNVQVPEHDHPVSIPKSPMQLYSPNKGHHLSEFPVDERNLHHVHGNPPQKVDELMKTFDKVNGVDDTDLETFHRKKEVQTALAQSNGQYIASVNKPGKEVYYPPGSGILINREEAMSSKEGGGRWAKASGMYEAESGYKSKTKTKSGGAMVPVCLPLCCAMPCSIM